MIHDEKTCSDCGREMMPITPTLATSPPATPTGAYRYVCPNCAESEKDAARVDLT